MTPSAKLTKLFMECGTTTTTNMSHFDTSDPDTQLVKWVAGLLKDVVWLSSIGGQGGAPQRQFAPPNLI